MKTIMKAINECYRATAKPEAQALMNLYSTIGEIIAQEDSSSFVGELAKEISAHCVGVKGFSIRNLRRMRDFYLCYEGQSALLKKVGQVSWAFNVVIMEQCSSLAEMEFYLDLVIAQNPKKTDLEEMISSGLFQHHQKTKVMEKVKEIHGAVSQPVANVSDIFQARATRTSETFKSHVQPFVRKKKTFLQGSSPPKRGRWIFSAGRSRENVSSNCLGRVCAVP
ncbi:MAG: DUF1016 N-terminal domain-containing protein [Eubacteriales bacterium]